MRWYNFLVHIFLTLSIGLNFALGVLTLTNMQYGIYTSTFYAQYGYGLKIVDVIYGIIVIFLAIYTVYVRSRLLRFKKNGPLSLYIMHTINIVTSTLYFFAASLATKTLMLDFASFTAILGSIALLIFHVIYFNKRSHRFTR